MFGFGRIGAVELILILVIVLVIFGPKKLPEIGRSLGKAIKELRSGTRGGNAEDETPSVEANRGDARAEKHEKAGE